VGYDNGDGKRRSLGTSATGARVALPIFEPILQTVWVEGIAPKAPLNGPSPEAKQHLVDLPIDYQSGARIKGGSQAFLEHFRVGADGKVTDTQNQLVRVRLMRRVMLLGPRLIKRAGGIGVGAIAERRLSKAGALGVGASSSGSRHRVKTARVGRMRRGQTRTSGAAAEERMQPTLQIRDLSQRINNRHRGAFGLCQLLLDAL
jgi:hypothetical protein